MGAVYATVADVLVKRPGMSLAEQDAAAVDLEEGSALLRQLVPGLDDAIAAGTVDALLVRKVLRDAVLRVLRNPTGVVSQTVGPESATFSGLGARAELGFLSAELALISPAGEGLSSGGFALGSARLGLPWPACSPLRSEAERWC
jgi:hypothetical protein